MSARNSNVNVNADLNTGPKRNSKMATITPTGEDKTNNVFNQAFENIPLETLGSCPTNYEGTWKLNSNLSDDIGPVLKLQNVNWLVRKTLQHASLRMQITNHTHEEAGESDFETTISPTPSSPSSSYTSSSPPSSFDNSPKSSKSSLIITSITPITFHPEIRTTTRFTPNIDFAGFDSPTNEKSIILDGKFRHISDVIFGSLDHAAQFIRYNNIDDEFLKATSNDTNNNSSCGNEDKEMEGITVVEERTWCKKHEWFSRTVWGFEVIDEVRRFTKRIIVVRGGVCEKVRLVYDACY